MLLCCGTVCGEGVQEGMVWPTQQSLASSPIPHSPQANWALLVLIPRCVVCVHSRTLWVPPMSSPVRLGVSPDTATPHRFFQSEVLSLYFPTLEPWVVQSVSLPSHSSWFTRTQMWDLLVLQPPPRLVCQLPPCCESSPPSYLSLPLLPVWMNVSSLTPWLSDFHTVQSSGSSG